MYFDSQNRVTIPLSLFAIGPAIINFLKNLLSRNITLHAHTKIINLLAVPINIVNALANAPQGIITHLLDNTNHHLVHSPKHALIVIQRIVIEVHPIQILILTQIPPINPLFIPLNNLLCLPTLNRLLNLSLKSICITQLFLPILLIVLCLLLHQKTLMLKL